MATITSAGAGSGIDLESVISASVAAKKTQLQQPITTKKTNTQITLTGVGQLKSAISTFDTTLAKLSTPGAFNKRAINITQDTDDPILKISSNTDASNGQYNVTVNKLATTSKIEGTFASSTSSLITEDGTLTFSAGDGNEFTVDVKKGDTLQQIRKRINNAPDNFGLTANIVNTSDGKAKLVIDSGVTGAGNDLKISGSTTELKMFEADTSSATAVSGSSMSRTQQSTDAEIDVDGNILTSDTNTFKDKVQGLDITVLRVSDKDSDGNLKSNKVDITTDKSAIKTLVQEFVTAYNTLIDKCTELGKRNTIVGGESQDDGGALAGDSMPRSIRTLMANTVMEPNSEMTGINSIFQVGIKMDNDGKLSVDSDKFDDALDDNYEQVVALFSGENGVAGKLQTSLKEYTKTGGLISQRQDQLNSDLRDLSSREATAADQLEKYEANLRAQYGSLDTLLAQMQSSASYLSLLSTS
ncbi:flagellar hook-associated protein 2 [Aeromonas caviae]|uniref:flagellar filament capping protein FliD n=1 Tax=Aeromonas caviae TaxID=648 RepID=UPI000DCFF50E|nr:flagellar filament capping protein FliD [Aeromonas caviae]MBL0537450.1 flagellar filament capping protein FliD [Aeromonas caviae]MCE9861807.1 flagellar filament capping protein FliD [Aeromonas caviae]MDH0029284.1 flagellar filament capping protein FliD [Aeromonas caviae]MDH0317277.1 flagellar filament capping protein FliD [Aeromonas caviae]MDH1081015.1 flagellar filament capping protein FliD [Aeromonas caviae]